MNATTLSSVEIDRIAHKRAAARLGLLVHASVFVLVNLGLAALALQSGRPWPQPPLFGWGLGLAIHAVVVQLLPAGAGMYQRLLQRERARLLSRRDPW